MATRVIEGWVASDGAISGHPGKRLSEQLLRRVATELKAQAIPLRLDHDDSQPVKSRVLNAEVRDRDGGLAVWVELEVEGSDEVISQVELRRGFSIAFADEPTVFPSPHEGAAAIELYADALNFDERALFEAAEQLSEAAEVHAAVLYQFGALPPAKIIIGVGWKALKHIGSDILIEGIKKLWSSRTGGARGMTVMELRLEAPDGRKLQASIKTSDIEVARQGIAALVQLGQPPDGQRVEYEVEDGSWRQIMPD